MAALQIPLENEAIASILEEHNTEYTIASGHIYGYIPYTSADGDGMEQEDLTGYTLKRLLWFLGY